MSKVLHKAVTHSEGPSSRCQNQF